MHVAITGHSKGIGAAIAHSFFATGNKVLGFSRSNGYDISTDEGIERIVDESKYADVFINNAYSGNSQTILLDKMFNLWYNNGVKTIVNINSRTKYGIGEKHAYYHDKKEFADRGLQYLHTPRQCRIINLYPGYIDTDMIADIDPRPESIMSIQEFTDIAVWAIKQPQHIEVGDLGVWCKR